MTERVADARGTGRRDSRGLERAPSLRRLDRVPTLPKLPTQSRAVDAAPPQLGRGIVSNQSVALNGMMGTVGRRGLGRNGVAPAKPAAAGVGTTTPRSGRDALAEAEAKLAAARAARMPAPLARPPVLPAPDVGPSTELRLSSAQRRRSSGGLALQQLAPLGKPQTSPLILVQEPSSIATSASSQHPGHSHHQQRNDLGTAGTPRRPLGHREGARRSFEDSSFSLGDSSFSLVGAAQSSDADGL